MKKYTEQEVKNMRSGEFIPIDVDKVYFVFYKEDGSIDYAVKVRDFVEEVTKKEKVKKEDKKPEKGVVKKIKEKLTKKKK